MGGCRWHGPITQADLLLRLGIQHRFTALAQSAQTVDERKQLQSAYDRLVNPDQVRGRRFWFD